MQLKFHLSYFLFILSALQSYCNSQGFSNFQIDFVIIEQLTAY